jgi:hypothetical protein
LNDTICLLCEENLADFDEVCIDCAFGWQVEDDLPPTGSATPAEAVQSVRRPYRGAGPHLRELVLG